MGQYAVRISFALCALSLAACASGDMNDRPINPPSGDVQVSTRADDGRGANGRWKNGWKRSGGSDHIRLVSVRPSFCYGGAKPPRYVLYPEGRWGAKSSRPARRRAVSKKWRQATMAIQPAIPKRR